MTKITKLGGHFHESASSRAAYPLDKVSYSGPGGGGGGSGDRGRNDVSVGGRVEEVDGDSVALTEQNRYKEQKELINLMAVEKKALGDNMKVKEVCSLNDDNKKVQFTNSYVYICRNR